MNFIDAIVSAVLRIFDFKTRSSRSEFWWFILLFVLGFTLTMQVDKVYPMDGYAMILEGAALLVAQVFWIVMPILYVVSLVLLVPLSVRRFHDTGKSGWFMLIVFVPFGIFVWLILMGRKGDAGFNGYGADPLDDGFDVFD